MSDIAETRPFLWNEIEVISQIGRVISAYNSIAYANEPGKKILYCAAYPDYVFAETGTANLATKPTRLICYDIVKKEDGSIGTDRFDSKKRVRPVKVFSNTVTLNSGQPDQIDKLQDIYSKTYDVLYRFDCLAPSDTESLSLVRDFERMMEIHAKYIEQGCHRFVYHGRRPAYFNRDTHYKSRTCEFFAQVEEQWYTVEDKIEQINMEILHLTQSQVSQLLEEQNG